MRFNRQVRAVFAPSEDASGGPYKATLPIDLSHLARQTMNDASLQREVLHIFVEQVTIARRDVPAAAGEERRKLAHKLKGAARAVGAFALADCAGRLMEYPDDEQAMKDLDRLADEAGAYAASLTGKVCR